jgi:hypothetical protein
LDEQLEALIDAEPGVVAEGSLRLEPHLAQCAHVLRVRGRKPRIPARRPRQASELGVVRQPSIVGAVRSVLERGKYPRVERGAARGRDRGFNRVADQLMAKAERQAVHHQHPARGRLLDRSGGFGHERREQRRRQPLAGNGRGIDERAGGGAEPAGTSERGGADRRRHPTTRGDRLDDQEGIAAGGPDDRRRIESARAG